MQAIPPLSKERVAIINYWCPGPDLNRHDLNGREILSLLCLPISPPGQRGKLKGAKDTTHFAFQKPPGSWPTEISLHGQHAFGYHQARNKSNYLGHLVAVTRGEFQSRVGFILAAAGSAVGLGNIWGFPTQAASNGGAAFLITYLIWPSCSPTLRSWQSYSSVATRTATWCRH